MELIFFLLAIVFVFVNMGSKNKKGQAPAAKQESAAPKSAARNAAARNAAAQKAAGMRAPVESKLLEWMGVDPEPAKARQEAPVQAATVPAEGRSMLEDAECAGGSMPHVHHEGRSALADEDCFGGSMEHTHSEGVSRSAHARRMAAIDAHTQDEDILPETIDARALRRAIVMAEVLGKPRALRR